MCRQARWVDKGLGDEDDKASGVGRQGGGEKEITVCMLQLREEDPGANTWLKGILRIN